MRHECAIPYRVRAGPLGGSELRPRFSDRRTDGWIPKHTTPFKTHHFIWSFWHRFPTATVKSPLYASPRFIFTNIVLYSIRGTVFIWFSFVKNVLIQTYKSNIFVAKIKSSLSSEHPVFMVCQAAQQSTLIFFFFDVTDVTPRRGNRWGLKFEKHYGNLVIHSMQKGERKVWDQSKCSRRSPLKASKKWSMAVDLQNAEMSISDSSEIRFQIQNWAGTKFQNYCNRFA